MKQARGYFITFEGIEGSGKTTQATRLYQVLKEKGYPVVLSREPGGTPIGERVRAILADPEAREMTPLTELFLFAAARAQHVHQVIRPMVEEGRIVICDRFYDATVAYQAYGRELPLAQVHQINELVAWNLRPDLTFLMDIEPYYAYGRVKERCATNESQVERIEEEDIPFFERVRHGYLNLAYEEPQRFRKFDSSQDLDYVHRQVLECALRELGKNWGDPQRLELRHMQF
jgi:dTMP kinase